MSSYEHMDGDSQTDTCCSGPFRTNIVKATYAIAIFGFLLSSIQALAALMPDSPHHKSTSLAVLYMLSALIYLSVILAQREKNPLLFLPYLISMGMSLVAYTIVCVGLAVLVIVAPKSLIDEWNKEHPDLQVTVEEFRIMMSFYLGVVGLSLALNGWFFSIIYRAYKHVKHGMAESSKPFSFVPPPV